jgi:membrane protein YqaA with SNARE-associated domain
MKHFFSILFAKYKFFVFVVLKPLGIWGLGALSFIDASSIAVPMDPLVASYVWANKSHFYLYVLIAALGSALGSLVPFFIGRAGGELFLLKRINRDRFEKLRARFERQEFLALLIPAMLPPPTPFKLFVFAAGVFEMRTLPFLIAVFAGRLLRFGITSILVVFYGPEIIHVIAESIHHHLGLTLTLFALLVAAVTWLFARQVIASRRERDASASDNSPAGPTDSPLAE